MTRIKIDFDYADEENEDTPVAAHLEVLGQIGESHYVDVRLAREHGPAGWPVFEAEGEWANVRRFLVEAYGGPALEADILAQYPELALPPAEADGPDGCSGWVLELHRASGSSTLHWGPFATRDEAALFALEHRLPSCTLLPLFLDVDWTRK